MFNNWDTGKGGRDVNMDISYNTITASGSRPGGDYDGIGIGGYSTSINSAWKNIKIHNNYVKGFENVGIHLTNSAGANSVVYDNIIDGTGVIGTMTGYAGIRLSGGAAAYNNILYNISNWAGIWITEDAGAAPSIVENNIFDTIHSRGVVCDSSDTHSVLNHNLFHNTLSGSSNNYATTCPKSWGDVNANPLFINASGKYSLTSDFLLQHSSPALGAGINAGISTDYAGNPFKNPPNIGVYE
jgi:hypothetical protein